MLNDQTWRALCVGRNKDNVEERQKKKNLKNEQDINKQDIVSVLKSWSSKNTEESGVGRRICEISYFIKINLFSQFGGTCKYSFNRQKFAVKQIWVVQIK